MRRDIVTAFEQLGKKFGQICSVHKRFLATMALATFMSMLPRSTRVPPPPAVVQPVVGLPPAGLTDAELARLPTHTIRPTGSDEDNVEECAICVEALVPGEALCALPPCAHAFHAACARAWLQRCALCPLCRAHVTVATPSAVASRPPPRPGREATAALESRSQPALQSPLPPHYGDPSRYDTQLARAIERSLSNATEGGGDDARRLSGGSSQRSAERDEGFGAGVVAGARSRPHRTASAAHRRRRAGRPALSPSAAAIADAAAAPRREAAAARLYFAWAHETGFQRLGTSGAAVTRARRVMVVAPAILPGGPAERIRAQEAEGLSSNERRIRREVAMAGVDRALGWETD